jgi:hypothetical protein
MLNLFTSILKLGILVGLTITIYTGCVHSHPDMIGLKILVWSLMIFGLTMGIKHWND